MRYLPPAPRNACATRVTNETARESWPPRRATSRHRVLRLEIIWSTVSREEAEAFVLSPGSVVERRQARLAHFETFRAAWEEEERRRSIWDEWALLSGSGS